MTKKSMKNIRLMAVAVVVTSLVAIAVTAFYVTDGFGLLVEHRTIINSKDEDSTAKWLLWQGDCIAQSYVMPADIDGIYSLYFYGFWDESSEHGITRSATIGISNTLTDDDTQWIVKRDYSGRFTYLMWAPGSVICDVIPGETYYFMCKITSSSHAFAYSAVSGSAIPSGTSYFKDVTRWNDLREQSVDLKLFVQGCLATTATYTLTIQTIPSSCTVKVNPGDHQENSGSHARAYFYDLAPDIYTVEVSKSGYTTETISVYLNEDETRTVDLDYYGGGDTILCYQCSGNTEISQEFAGSTCPSGWYPYHQDCGAPSGEYILQVYTKDASTLQGIPAVAVSCSGKTYYTNLYGSTSFLLAPGTYTVTATKSGYQSGSVSAMVTANTPLLTIYLTPEGGYTLTVTVFDDSTNGLIDGATVIIGSDSETTTSTGTVTFTLESGTYIVSASKSGYAVDVKTVIIANADDTLAFYLVPSDGAPGVPGFEILAFIVAIGITGILLKRKRKK